MTPTANNSIRRNTCAETVGQPRPEPPDKTKATAGNGGNSQNIKADDLALSMVQPTTDVDLSFDDRHAAYCAGYDDGMHHKFGLDVAEAAQAALADQALEALGMARRCAVHGPAFSAMVLESGERE